MTALATIPQSRPLPTREMPRRPMSRLLDITQSLDGLWNLATLLIESRLLPSTVDRPEKAVAIILKGDELGIAPMHALDGINIIQGKPTVSPQVMLSLVEASGLLEDKAVEETADSCTITYKRRGRSPQTVTFTRADAVAMGLASKDNWKKQFGVMMYWRCESKAVRRVFPDVIAGCYTPEEMGAEVDEDGVLAPASQKFPDQGSGHGRTGSYASDADDAAFVAMLKEAGAALARDWKASWNKANGRQADDPILDGLKENPVPSREVIRHIYDVESEAGRLIAVETTTDAETGEVVPRASIEQLRKIVAICYARDPGRVRKLAGDFMQRRAMDEAFAFADANRHLSLPVDFDPEFNVMDDAPAPEDESQEPAEDRPAPPEKPRRPSKKERAEAFRLELEAKNAEPEQPRGDAYEGDYADSPDPAMAGKDS